MVNHKVNGISIQAIDKFMVAWKYYLKWEKKLEETEEYERVPLTSIDLSSYPQNRSCQETTLSDFSEKLNIQGEFGKHDEPNGFKKYGGTSWINLALKDSDPEKII